MSKRELLKNELLNLKACGYRVFINKNDNENDSYLNYGLISDGTNILYVQFAEFSTWFTISFRYYPSRNHGSGCMYCDSENIIEMQNITKTDIKNIIAYGLAYCRRNHVQRYASLDDYFNKDFFAKNHYIEL